MTDGPWAHSKNERGERDPLVTHLRDTAERAKEFASAFDAGELAHWLGLWHDLGKFHPDWQDYLLRAEAWDASGEKKSRPKSPDHKAAGVRIAGQQGLATCAFALHGHHGGMGEGPWKTTRENLKFYLDGPTLAGPAEEALRRARLAMPDLVPATRPPLPAFVASRVDAELFVRMLFSALVDADFLDTEEHFKPSRTGLRGPQVTLGELWQRLEADEAAAVAAGKREPGIVNNVRRDVLEACLEAAPLPRGFFRLTVPTGGGKTRSGMAFALQHALAHGLRRVVVAVPFITIAEQSADTLAAAFDSPAPDDVTREYERVFRADAVLQHFGGGLADGGDFRQKLAAENWDAPVIVTSTVQLFESLFSNRPAACRKLHRLAKSVIILDEAQALPPNLLEPILDVLRALVRDYGASVVFSTATQPSFESIRGFADLGAREIVPGFAGHFEALRRVRYAHLEQPQPWDAVADRMLQAPAAMTIVNTRAHAAELFEMLQARAPAGTVFHLSTRMVQGHRRRVLDEVRERLVAEAPCYLVATQVVEAGVDISFPLVLRALAPLDAIVQAAGRCNRHGELGFEGGEVVVFEPVEAAMPKGPYTIGATHVRGILSRGEPLEALSTQAAYWPEFFGDITSDLPGIQELRAELDYPMVAKRFAMIEETVSVVVTSEDASGRAAAILAQLVAGQAGRQELRALQPFLVSLRQHEVERLEASGVLRVVAPGLAEWLGDYGPTGIVLDVRSG